jgi:hypothetical protein
LNARCVQKTANAQTDAKWEEERRETKLGGCCKTEAKEYEDRRKRKKNNKGKTIRGK